MMNMDLLCKRLKLYERLYELLMLGLKTYQKEKVITANAIQGYEDIGNKKMAELAEEIGSNAIEDLFTELEIEKDVYKLRVQFGIITSPYIDEITDILNEMQKL